MISLTFQTLLQKLQAAAPTIVLIDGSNPIRTDPDGFVDKFVTVGLSLGTVVAVVLVAIGGYRMMMGKGDAKVIQDAQDQIQNAILGFMLILLAVALVKIILNALGITGVVQ